jgi:putative membrane protein
MMHWGDDWSSWWWWMPVGMVLFWVLVTVVIVLVVRALGRPQSDPDPRGVLDERYARGEIDDDEYRRRRATMHELRGGR